MRLIKNHFTIVLTCPDGLMIFYWSTFRISRAVAMPEMIVACEVTHNMDKGITRFIIPLAVTVSANGSAVFIACASLFCCNISGFPPTAADAMQIG